MFSKKDFQTWGKDNAVLFAAVMTKIDGRAQDDLLRTYEFRGFPSLALLDADGTAIKKGLARDLYSIKNVVKAAPLYQAMQAKLDAGTAVDQRQWLLARLGMGKVDAEEARTEIASLDWPGKGKLKKQVEQQLFVMEMTALSRRAGRRNAEAEVKAEACAAVYEAFKAGRRLPPGSAPVAFFDDMLVDAAMAGGDHEAFAFAAGRVRAALQDRIKAMEQRLPRYRADLEKFKDDERTLPRIHSAIERTETQLAEARKKLADMAAFAAKAQRD